MTLDQALSRWLDPKTGLPAQAAVVVKRLTALEAATRDGDLARAKAHLTGLADELRVLEDAAYKARSYVNHLALTETGAVFDLNAHPITRSEGDADA
jgi:hypothetical protein